MAGSARYAWNVVRFSVFTAVAALTLVAGFGTLWLLSTTSSNAQATTEVVGRIVPGYQPPDEKALVAWNDDKGVEQLTWFELDEPSQWAAGRPFRLRYDPDEAGQNDTGPFLPPPERERVVSAEPGARNADHPSGWDFWWPTAVIGGVVFLVLLAWGTRRWLNRSAAAGRSEPMRVVVVRGHSNNRGANTSMAVLLAPPGTPLDADEPAALPELPRVVPGARWQRVHWHPALELLPPGQTVTARLRDGFGARAVLEPEPGVLVRPAGRLRAKAPWGVRYVVPPTRTRPRWSQAPTPPLAVWLIPFPAGLVAAVRGHVLALAPLTVLGLLVATTFFWAWFAPAPEDR